MSKRHILKVFMGVFVTWGLSMLAEMWASVGMVRKDLADHAYRLEQCDSSSLMRIHWTESCAHTMREMKYGSVIYAMRAFFLNLRWCMGRSCSDVVQNMFSSWYAMVYGIAMSGFFMAFLASQVGNLKPWYYSKRVDMNEKRHAKLVRIEDDD